MPRNSGRKMFITNRTEYYKDYYNKNKERYREAYERKKQKEKEYQDQDYYINYYKDLASRFEKLL